jgi:hypothetical protein
VRRAKRALTPWPRLGKPGTEEDGSAALVGLTNERLLIWRNLSDLAARPRERATRAERSAGSAAAPLLIVDKA